MKLLANENFPPGSVLYLRKKGFDVISTGQDYPGTSDEEVLALLKKKAAPLSPSIVIMEN